MDLEFLARADSATLKLELAKQAIESAKSEFEACKKAYDEVMAQAEEHGIPKAKLKKLTEERIQALFDSGMVSRTSASSEPVAKKKTKPKAKKVIEDHSETADGDDIEFTELADATPPEADA